MQDTPGVWRLLHLFLNFYWHTFLVSFFFQYSREEKINCHGDKLNLLRDKINFRGDKIVLLENYSFLWRIIDFLKDKTNIYAIYAYGLGKSCRLKKSN